MSKIKCSEFSDTIENIKSRIGNNSKYGDNDLQSWLLEHLKVKENEHVLDIGCGNGTHLREVATRVKHDNYCSGIDYNESTIKLAKEESKGFKPTVTFLHMDMDTLGDTSSPFKDNSFDLIYAAYAFYYSKYALKTLDVLKKKIKPKGRIAIIGPHGDNNKEWFVFLTQFMKLQNAVVDASSTFMEKIEKYARENFVHIEAAEFVNNITFPSYDILATYWKSNIYYDPQYDTKFEKYAREHFKKYKVFRYAKKAKMVVMKEKKFM